MKGSRQITPTRSGAHGTGWRFRPRRGSTPVSDKPGKGNAPILQEGREGYAGFSRKAETGYTGIAPARSGLRFYNPGIGRWTSRDPIGERGGYNVYAFCQNSPVFIVDPYGDDWLDTAANFSAGVADSLAIGITSWARRELGWDDAVDYGSGVYIAGEVTEIVVETVITLGGATLRKVAVVHSGRIGRRMLVPRTERLRRVLGVASDLTGQVHHINPIRKGRFPLPFRWASNSWNLKFMRGPSRGINPLHAKAHAWLSRVDQLDVLRTWTQPIRNAGAEIVRQVNASAGNAFAVQSPNDEKEPTCLYAPDISIEVYFEAYRGVDLYYSERID